MIEPIKRFRIGKSLLLSISQLQMQFGISPLETHKPRLKMSPSRSKDDIRRRCVPTTHSCSYPLHQRRMVLRAFGCTGRRKFFDTLADNRLVKYTPFASKGGRQMGVPRRGGAATGKNLIYIALDGRLMAGWGRSCAF